MNRTTIFSNLIWRFLERCGAQLVTFVVSIVLARLLDPNVYGIIALVTIFTSILQVFVDSGLGNALIQKKDADDLDFSTVFYFNILVCVILYLIMFIAAPFIATFYKMPELISVIRVLSLVLVISGVKNVQQAYVSKNMLFKRFFFSTLGGTIGAAIIGIWIAYKGYGVWALVAQNIFNLSIDTIILWITVKWRPKLVFSFKRLKTLYSFGWKLLGTSLINNVYNNIRQLVIGKMYSSSDLAYYNRGKQFPQLIDANVNTSIDSVLLPALSKEQDDKKRIKVMTRRAIKTSTYILFPLLTGLAVCAKPFVELILTEKWLESVPFLQIFCIAYMFEPIQTANLNAIKAIGRSDIFFIQNLIKRSMGIILLIITLQISVKAIALSFLVSGVIGLIVDTYPNQKMLQYNLVEQLKDIFPHILLSTCMGIPVYLLGNLPFTPIIVLIIQVIIGISLYLCMSILFKVEMFSYLVDTVKSVIKK